MTTLKSRRDRHLSGPHLPASGPPIVLPASLPQRFRGLLRAARPRQWIKNLVCFAGLIFSGRLFQVEAALEAIVAFVGFCLAASGIYLLNDICDRQSDRHNPKKRGRPIASGLVPVSWAFAASAVLIAMALASSVWLGPACAGVLVCYVSLSLAYSLRLKHVVLIDVLIIALGFVLRVLFGVYAVAVLPSPWIVLCMFFLSLFLGFAKRRGELNLVEDVEHFRRPVLRDYASGFLDHLLSMTAVMAIMCYALYTVSGRDGNASLVVTVPLVVFGVVRYLLMVTVHGLGDTPERQLIADRAILANAVLWIACCVALIYFDVDFFRFSG